MKIRERVGAVLSKTEIGARVVADKRYRIVLTATGALVFNLAYALYHGVLGIMTASWWLSALCAYYVILATTRFAAVLCERKNGSEPSLETEYFVMGVCGALLLLLTCVLAGVNYMSLTENMAAKYDEITMITIATYTFTKIIMAIIRLVKQRCNPSPLLATIRRIGYADIAVSVLTMQRSMLVSFGEMASDKIYMLNALTGAAVYVFIFIIGIFMIKESRGKKDGKV